MTTQRRITRPGIHDNEFMLVTCTPDETAVEFMEFQGEAEDAARENLHPTTTTYVGQVLKQGEHAVRGTASHIALLAHVDQELRNILRKQYGATNRKQIAATLQAMLDGQLEAMRKVHRGEETDREDTHPGLDPSRVKMPYTSVRQSPLGWSLEVWDPNMPEGKQLVRSERPLKKPTANDKRGALSAYMRSLTQATDALHKANELVTAPVCTCPPSPVPTLLHEDGCPSRPRPPSISCHAGNRCSNWPQCEHCGPARL